MAKTRCIKVGKAEGEKAIVVAKRLALLNKDVKVEHNADFVYVPLIREPQKTDLEEMQKNLSWFEFVHREYLEYVKSRRRLIDVLSDSLPPHLLASVPRAIDFVGDIAVVEILPELETYKKIVGQAILEINKPTGTVLVKAGPVDGEYRLREFETIAGVRKTATVHREYGCVFYVDLAGAFFSPRLSYEHNRVASLVEEGEKVLDMFAGVGPFSILIAKKRQNVHIYAAEVNPTAFKLLKQNTIANRVEKKITAVLGDVRRIVDERLEGATDRVIMNLPEKATEFIGVACRAVKPEGGIIHYYEFTNLPEPLKMAEARLQKALKQTSREIVKILHSRVVRGVAPFTWQVVVDARIR